jgi:hypothetical protein
MKYNSWQCQSCKRRRSLKANPRELGAVMIMVCQHCGQTKHTAVLPAETKHPKLGLRYSR